MSQNAIDRTIFQRTVAGQQAALKITSPLTSDQQRVLLMINGETPFAALQALIPEIDGPRVVRDLLAAGLIAEVRPNPEPDAPDGRPAL